MAQEHFYFLILIDLLAQGQSEILGQLASKPLAEMQMEAAVVHPALRCWLCFGQPQASGQSCFLI